VSLTIRLHKFVNIFGLWRNTLDGNPSVLKAPARQMKLMEWCSALCIR